jgi:hypothetical protein
MADRVMIVTAIAARAAEATVAVATTTLLTKATRVKATRARAASPTLPHLPGPPSTILGLGSSTCTLIQLQGEQQHRLPQQKSKRLSSLLLA